MASYPPGFRARRILAAAALAALPAALPACGGGAAPAPSSDALVSILTSSLPSPVAGVEYAATLAARGPNPPLVWRVAAGRLPEGLLLDPETGEIAGFPRRAGRNRATFEVRDGADPRLVFDPTVASDSRSFALDVLDGPVSVLPTLPPPAQFAAAYGFSFVAAGGSPPYRFEAASGTGVPGLSLSADGRLAGIPTEANGPYDLVVRATDAREGVAERRFTVRVVVLPLAIANEALPDAAAGFAYSQALSTHPDGGGPPFRWSVPPLSGPLPPGLALDADTGALAGKAMAVGTWPFLVRVTDAAGQSSERGFSIRVNPGPVLERIVPPVPRKPGAAATLVGQAFQPGMTVRFGIAPPVEATVLDATRATVAPPTAPPQSGTVAVVVGNPDGGTYAKPGAWRYSLASVLFVAAGVEGTARDHSRGIAAGDVNRDGLCDLVHVGSAGIEVISPSGPAYSGTWTTKTVRSDGSFNDVRLADVDRDGDLDVVVSRSSTAESIEVYKNDGLGGFPGSASASTTYAKPSFHYPHSMDVGDVDADGVPDVAFTSCRGNQSLVVVMRGLGDGTFLEVHRADGAVFDDGGGLWAANAIALADLDGDGRDDLLVTDSFPAACATGSACPSTPAADAHAGDPHVVAWRALSGPGGVPGAWTGLSISGASALLDGDNEGLCVYDHDGDGLLDLAVFGGYQDVKGRGIAWLSGDGRGGFLERYVQVTSYNRRFGARLDANLDGCDDLLVVGGDGTAASGWGTDLSIAECWLGGADLPVKSWSSGPETLSGGSLPGANPGRVVTGDFDGDGLVDFAVSQSFNAKERYGNDQADGSTEGVAVYLNRSH